MTDIIKTQLPDGSKVFDVTLTSDEDHITLATADTYVDKNIVVNIESDGYVKNLAENKATDVVVGNADTNIKIVSGGIYLDTAEGDKAYYKDEEIATVDDLETYVFDNEKVAALVARADRIDTVADSIRGRSVLPITVLPTNDNGTTDGFAHNYYKTVAAITAESRVDNVFVGDALLHSSGLLYLIGAIANGNAYLSLLGNIRGAQGEQGIQGEQGPQGPKGDPGQGYFIVTDEDYEKIADFVEEKSYHSYQRPDASEPLRPNIFYDFGQQYHLDITFAPPQSIYRSNEYMFQFESPSDRPTTLVMPASVRWCYDPIIETGKTYQVSVLNDLAVICGA